MAQDDINATAARVISIEADAMHQMVGDLPSVVHARPVRLALWACISKRIRTLTMLPVMGP